MAVDVELAKRYVEMCKKMLEYSEISKPPQYIVDYYVDALLMYRKNLDGNGYKMPRPLYKFIFEDQRTWRYLKAVTNDYDYLYMVSNPDFKYKI